MALPPDDAPLVITPTARGQDLYSAIALPSTVSSRDAKRAARDMRRSAQGARLQAACVAEVVLGDPARRQAYDAMRARAAAAGLPLPAIGAVMPAQALPPPARARARRWLLAHGPVLAEKTSQAFQVTGRFTLNLLRVTFVILLLIGAIVCMAKYAPPPRNSRYDVKLPEYHYTPPPDWSKFDYEPYVVPKLDYTVPEIYVPPITPPPPPEKHRRKKPR